MARRDLVKTTASYVDPASSRVVALGEFRTFTGGELTSADIKTTPGAGLAEVARGGRQTVGNVTISREDDGSLDLKWVASRRGKGGFVVTRTPLDEDNNPIDSRSITYTGKIVRVAPGEGDAQSDTDLDEFEIEMSCDGFIS